jgi:hypothetical protein
MTTTTSRRAILAGAAALPALTVSPVALAATPDPIFAAIERHKDIFRSSLEARRVWSDTPRVPWSEEAWEADVRFRWVHRRENRAGRALATVRPTTVAGVVALIEYVEAFNAGAFKLPHDTGWASEPCLWPPEDIGSDIDMFGFMLLSNVRAALQAMAVQS